MFLEMDKHDKSVESHLNHLDKLTNVNTCHEFDNEIPHLEVGSHILVQSLESPFATPSPPHKNVHATSPKWEVQLDDVIDRLGRFNLEENESPPVEQPRHP